MSRLSSLRWLLLLLVISLPLSGSVAAQCDPFDTWCWETQTALPATWTPTPAPCDPFDTNCWLTATALPGGGATTTPGTPDVGLLPPLLPTPTSFEASSLCPDGVWSADDLDPQWALACRQCLPAAPTPTAGGFAVLPTYPVATFELADLSTSTPFPTSTTSVTPTATNTPTQMATTTPDAPNGHRYAYIDFDGRSDVPWAINSSGAGFSVNHGFVTGLTGFGISNGHSGAGYDGWWNPLISSSTQYPFVVYLNPAWTVYNVRWDARWTGSGGSLGTQYWAFNINGGGSTQFAAVPGYGYPAWSTSWTSGYVQVNSGYGLSGYSALYYSWPGNATADLIIDNIRIEYDGVPATQTPTATSTVSPSPTLTGTITPVPTATATPDRQFVMLADCRVPVYRPVVSPPVDVGINDDVSVACYRLFPQITVNNDTIISIHVNVPAVDLCLEFMTPHLSVLGVEFPLEFVITVALAIFLFRWALWSA